MLNATPLADWIFSTLNTSEHAYTDISPLQLEEWWWEKIQVKPDWLQLQKTLEWVWQVHTFGLACLFLFMACVSFFTFLSLQAQLSARPNLSTLSVCLCISGVTQSLGLFIDPYGSKEMMPNVLTAILGDLTFPCLLSSLSFLQIDFQHIIQINVDPSSVTNETLLSVIITSHFFLVLAADILWTLKSSYQVIWLVTQLIFTAWGIYLSSSCLWNYSKFLRSLVNFPLVFLSRNDLSFSSQKGFYHLGRPAQTSITTVTKSRLEVTSSRSKSYDYMIQAPQGGLTYDQIKSSSKTTTAEGIDHNDSSVTKPQSNCFIISPEARKSLSYEINSCLDQPTMPANSQLVQPLQTFRLESNSTGPFILGHIDNSVSSSGGQASQQRRRTLPNFQAMEQMPCCEFRSSRCSLYQSQRSSRTFSQEFQTDTNDVRLNRRSRVEKRIRKIIAAAMLGLTLCMLQLYSVLGPHGLFAESSNVSVVPWFCFQTVCRIVEFLLGYLLISITKYSLHSYCCRDNRSSCKT
ncbi:uncharacterized protein LOC111086054 [Limulus polyphemus]|uniref:Uncharacterized protein LOC111086054 n=1 Tax=Limulus polyphemus TaxID=6850 RepID=A0ABM1SHM8_LIMPO|nr:uncharacterized protein LOC111086054 [Limulus polyphemus]